MEQREQKLSREEVVRKRLLRECLFKLLFAAEFGSETDQYTLDLIQSELCEREQEDILLDPQETRLVQEKAQDMLAKREELDERIGRYTRGWKTDRLALVDKMILRMAIYDLLYSEDIPRNVTISEAVMLAGVFHDDKAKAFVNGTLSSIYKDLE